MGYKLPETLRTSLRKPIGKLFTGNALNAARNAKNYILLNNPRITIAIGDYCTKTLIDVEFFPDIVIYDGKTLREKEITLNLDSYDEKSVINPREWILTVAWDVIEKAIAFCTKQINVSDKCRVAVRIDGEEDLLVIPTIISLPIGSVIVYGQPPLNNDEGIVVVLITPSLKKLGHELLEKFEFHEEFINGNNYH
ncbi:MAG: GTP-dependent dephospho-CoA kinase family protein [Candidatus Heimdallarchaeota archaeon]|nr:MAG: GTP-dependent dephospho-CoA kinase family protein [Candidatus Heimdallarchaeota archaeon]